MALGAGDGATRPRRTAESIAREAYRSSRIAGCRVEYSRLLDTARALKMVETTVQISFADLWATGCEEERLPLSEVRDWEWHHIHGHLSIQIAGRSLPYLSYFGVDDACFDTWPAVLKAVVDVLEASLESEYVWDEGEQGQPAFRFVRRDRDVRISIVEASSVSGGNADPEWQDITCRYEDFRQEVSRFLERLHQEVSRQAPGMAQEWWDRMLATPF